MRHYRTWAVLWIAAAVLIGCGPAKELPDDGSGSKGSDRGSTEPKEVIPASSDPVAKEIVDRAIKAHTQNNPSLLKKGKVSKMTATGTIKVPVESRMANPQTVLKFFAAWPDRIKAVYEYKTELNATDTLLLRRPFQWISRDRAQIGIPQPQVFEDAMLSDCLAQHWLPLVFPLADPRAIVYEPKKGVGSPTADVVRFHLPERPTYSLSFDTSSGYLIQVSYSQRWKVRSTNSGRSENTSRSKDSCYPRNWTTRTPERSKGEVVQQWTVDTWEFPEKPDDATFDPPK